MYLVAVHLLRAQRYRESAPDCHHAQHGKNSHVCEAFRIIEEAKAPMATPIESTIATELAFDPVAPVPQEPTQVAPPEPPQPDASQRPTEEPADDADAPGAPQVGPAQAAEPSAEPRPIIDQFENRQLVPSLPPTPQLMPGVGSVTTLEILRSLGFRGGLQEPTIVHLHQAGETLDVMVITGHKGDEAFRIHQTRQRSLEAEARTPTAGPPAPSKYVNLQRLADFFEHDVGHTGAACTDAIKELGPWKPEEFDRNRADFRLWQEAYHEVFRAGQLERELQRRRKRLCKATRPGKDGKPVFVMNEFGEQVWFVEAIR